MKKENIKYIIIGISIVIGFAIYTYWYAVTNRYQETEVIGYYLDTWEHELVKLPVKK